MLKSLEPLRTNTEHTCKNRIGPDQGVMTFLTGFDTEGNGFKFGKYGDQCAPEEPIESRQLPISHVPEDQ
jgi:hypothetical protein